MNEILNNSSVANLEKKLKSLDNDFELEIAKVKSLIQIEEIRINFLGKKSIIVDLFSQLKTFINEDKKTAGALINNQREKISNQIESIKHKFETQYLQEKLATEKIDATSPYRKQQVGLLHPLSKVFQEIKEIFGNLGFELCEGPEIEDDFHNFSALNIPKHHPARQMQDTFYLKNSEKLLRTHTSNVQIREMIKNKPPLKIIALGRVFRSDSDQTHTPMFHQIEGFVVDKEANFGNLKWVLESFLEQFFETKNLELRLRPSCFPFTEPSAEVDINYQIENGRIKIGKGDKFLEILGCGIINREVLKNCQIDSEEFQGFAFGIGVERLAMLKYGITDLRMLFDNDIRFLEHYGFKAYQF